MPQQHAVRESKRRRPELRRDADQFSLGLGDDENLAWAKLIAGTLSIVVLVAMLITALFRALNPLSTAVLAALAVGLVVAMGVRVRRHRVNR